MIVVRDIFNLKFGKAKDARALLDEAKGISKKYGVNEQRALTDLTGDSYRLVLESEWKSLADWEKSMKEGLGAADWQKWYQKFVPLVERASREILNILD